MSRFECENADAPAPRVGCGCRGCYRAREASLDPRLMELVQPAVLVGLLAAGSQSQNILHRYLAEYCAGRLEYGGLHVGIIRALMQCADQQAEVAMTLVNSRPMAFPWVVTDGLKAFKP